MVLPPEKHEEVTEEPLQRKVRHQVDTLMSSVVITSSILAFGLVNNASEVTQKTNEVLREHMCSSFDFVVVEPEVAQLA